MGLHPAVQFMIVLAVLIIVVYAIFRKVPISLRGGPVHIDLSARLDDMSTQLAEIGHAVNHVPVGEPTLVQRVQRVEASIEGLQSISHWQADATHRVAAYVGLVLPVPPDRRQNDRHSA